MNEVWHLTALAGSNTILTIYISNVLPLFNLFSQYGIYTKLFLHFINCLCNIISFTVKLRSVHACWLVLGILVFCLIFFFFLKTHRFKEQFFIFQTQKFCKLSTTGTKYSRIDQVTFMEDSF